MHRNNVKIFTGNNKNLEREFSAMKFGASFEINSYKYEKEKKITKSIEVIKKEICITLKKKRKLNVPR